MARSTRTRQSFTIIFPDGTQANTTSVRALTHYVTFLQADGTYAFDVYTSEAKAQQEAVQYSYGRPTSVHAF
jgi:hypothetical protein